MAKDINPNSRNPFVDNTGRLSKYGMDVILKLYRTLQFSGDSSLLDDLLSQGIALTQGEDSAPDFEYIDVSSNFTTYTNCFLNVTSSNSVISLNDEPEDGEQVIVHKNTNSEIDHIDVTDGTGTDRFIIDQSVLSYRYSIELNQWVRGS